MRKQRINAIVVTYNRCELLMECIEAILNQTYPVTQLTIVDNASTDDTSTTLQKMGYLNNPKIKYLKLKDNLGGAGGFYHGLKDFKSSDFDWAWIMDDDVVPQKNSLEELINALKITRQKKISFLASTVFGENREFMNVPQINEDAEKNGYASWYEYLDEGLIKIKKATFVSLLINIDAVKKIGLPCKDYFIWGDDSEYTQRLTKYYGQAYLVGKSIVIHKRKNAKSLSIFNFEDKARLQKVWRLYRNNLINDRYYLGGKAATKKCLNDFKLAIKCLGHKNWNTMINQIVKGDYLGIVQYKKFKKYIDNQLKNID